MGDYPHYHLVRGRNYEGEGQKMKVGELSGEIQAPNKCCNASDEWIDCNYKEHNECFATRCEKCGQVTYRDCEGEVNA